MKLHFYGADRCVTGSCHCLEINGKKILVDCGLQQGRDELDNRYLAFAPGNIDILLVTHAHIDHTGRIPLLVKNGFHGRILTTRLTADLMKIMLLDSAHIQESDAEYENRKGERAGREHVDPLYTEQDALDVFKYVTTCEYKEKVDLCEGVSAVFTDAGHLLGSASITLELEENGVHKTIVFSGDIGNVDQPIIRDPQLLKKADYVVMESTYGDRNHTEVWSYTDELAQIIDETLGKGGNVVIPSFAVLLDRGVIDESGRLLPPQDAPEDMRRYLTEDGQGNGVFHLTKAVSLTARDVRNLQLAKAAVAGGIRVLLEQRGVTADDIASVELAGGFGNYLSPESAVHIGMLPRACLSKIRPLGNTALAGASMLALDGENWRKLAEIPEKCRYLELSGRDDFSHAFTDSLTF